MHIPDGGGRERASWTRFRGDIFIPNFDPILAFIRYFGIVTPKNVP